MKVIKLPLVVIPKPEVWISLENPGYHSHDGVTWEADHDHGDHDHSEHNHEQHE